MKTNLTSYTKKAFFLVLSLLSATTSYLFFTEAFSTEDVIARIMTGAVGVVVTDIAAHAWVAIYLRGCDNNGERALSFVGAGVGAAGSLVCSLMYIVSLTSWVYLPPEVAGVSVIVMSIIIAVHFSLVMLFTIASSSARIDDATADMMSKTMEDVIASTRQRFDEISPMIAQQRAEMLARELASRLAGGSAVSQLPAPPRRLPATAPAMTATPATMASPAQPQAQAQAQAQAQPVGDGGRFQAIDYWGNAPLLWFDGFAPTPIPNSAEAPHPATATASDGDDDSER